MCIKPGIQERGTECGERGEWGNVVFRGMSPNISVNVAKHSGPGNVAKYSGECRQTFQGISSNIPGMSPNILGNMSSNIPGNFTKHFRESCQFLV